MNTVIIIGKVTNLSDIRTLESGVKVANVDVEIERTYANSDGVYESDTFSVTLWKSLAENLQEVVSVGDTIGVKGRLVEKTTSKGFRLCEIVAEKVTAISKGTAYA